MQTSSSHGWVLFSSDSLERGRKHDDRFKKGGCRFLGTVPIYNFDAALVSEARARKRALEVFQACMDVLSTELREFCSESCTMRDGGGRFWEAVPRVAFFAADYQQIHQHVCMSGLGCHACKCSFKDWDHSAPASGADTWEFRNFAEIIKELEILAGEVLDSDGKIKRGNFDKIKAWKKKWKMRFMRCGFAKLLDVDFDVLLGTPRDLLHHILLGIFGEHILKAIVSKIEQALGRANNPKYWESGGSGRPALMSDQKMNAIFERLTTRLGMVNQDESGFTIGPGTAQHFQMVKSVLSCLFHNIVDILSKHCDNVDNVAEILLRY